MQPEQIAMNEWDKLHSWKETVDQWKEEKRRELLPKWLTDDVMLSEAISQNQNEFDLLFKQFINGDDLSGEELRIMATMYITEELEKHLENEVYINSYKEQAE